MPDLRTDDFDYELPEELIAQRPPATRGTSRLMVLDRETRGITHTRFGSLPAYLKRGDLLVANRSKVIPARLRASKVTGGSVELLLLRQLDGSRWTALARPSRKLKAGMTLRLGESSVNLILHEHLGGGQWELLFEGTSDSLSAIGRLGETPLPPYIRSRLEEPDRYQTVYADREGSVAAPTAGLHFTPELLALLEGAGIGIQYLTLHVGLGTFRPVSAKRVRDHAMMPEWGEVPTEVADAVNRTRESGGRIVAIGTTTTRLLESAWTEAGMSEFVGETNRFIYPGYTFGAIDALITNFHLPKSTLLMLVSAFAGREFIMEAYGEAVKNEYRFFSFGDAMLIH